MQCESILLGSVSWCSERIFIQAVGLRSEQMAELDHSVLYSTPSLGLVGRSAQKTPSPSRIVHRKTFSDPARYSTVQYSRPVRSECRCSSPVSNVCCLQDEMRPLISALVPCSRASSLRSDSLLTSMVQDALHDARLDATRWYSALLPMVSITCCITIPGRHLVVSLQYTSLSACHIPPRSSSIGARHCTSRALACLQEQMVKRAPLLLCSIVLSPRQCQARRGPGSRACKGRKRGKPFVIVHACLARIPRYSLAETHVLSFRPSRPNLQFRRPLLQW